MTKFLFSKIKELLGYEFIFIPIYDSIFNHYQMVVDDASAYDIDKLCSTIKKINRTLPVRIEIILFDDGGNLLWDDEQLYD